MPRRRGRRVGYYDLPVGVPLMQCHPHSYGLGLSAIRATAARDGLYDLDLVAGTGVLDKVPDVHGALVASVGALVLVVGCCVEGIAGWRYPGGVHSCLLKWLWAGLRGVPSTCGAIRVVLVYPTLLAR